MEADQDTADQHTTVLAQLPSGIRIASQLIPDQSPPRHVYRVIDADGAVLSEHATLLRLIDSVEPPG